jgi:uncharacterized protein (DUF2062 family)
MRALLRRRLVEPISRQLTQGASPSRLALALALGLVLGTIPILGATTALCACAGVALRLNQPAIQVANYAAYPVQLALFVPFFKAGAWLFGAPPVTFTLADARAALARDAWGTAVAWAGANVRAVAAWGLLAPAVALALYVTLRPLVARLRTPARA